MEKMARWLQCKQADYGERGQKGGKGGSRSEQKGNDQREEAWVDHEQEKFLKSQKRRRGHAEKEGFREEIRGGKGREEERQKDRSGRR
jgi:hypothetical protein